jgi:Zn-dependent metalloprotease
MPANPADKQKSLTPSSGSFDFRTFSANFRNQVQTTQPAAGTSQPMKLLDRPLPAATNAKVALTSRKAALTALKSQLSNLSVHYNPRNKSASFLKAQDLGKVTNSAVTSAKTLSKLSAPSGKALQCLNTYRDFFRINDASGEFTSKKESLDTLGLTHVRLQQTYDGIPVWGREVYVHLDRSDSPYLIAGKVVPTPAGVNITPVITTDQASSLVLTDLAKSANLSTPVSSSTEDLSAETPSTEILTTELVIHIGELDIARLAYHITAGLGLDRWQYFVDARTGMILEKYNDTHTESVAGSGTDLSDDTQNFFVWLENNTYYLVDTSLAMHTTNPDMPGSKGKGNVLIYNLKNQDSSRYATASILTSTSATSGWDTTGVTAMNHFRTIVNYYKNTFDRDSFDDNNANIVGYIHVSRDYDNAFYDSDVDAFFFGDGGTEFYPLVKGLDVMAHEFTHGVTQYSAALEYTYQSGALNEGFSDIFACMVDRNDWDLAEDCTKVAPFFLRSITKPHQGLEGTHPANMSEYQNLSLSDDNGGVHVNSTIPSRACYYLAEGLTSESLGTSIGRNKAEQIFYRALTRHLTQASDFYDCRLATIQSASELYGESSAEVTATAAAWDAVGVTSTGSDDGDDTDDTEVNPLNGEDKMIYVYYINKNAYLGLTADGKNYQLSSHSVAFTRPAVVDNGKKLLYVDSYYQLRLASLDPDNSADTSVSGTSSIRSIAGSSDSRYFAFTTTSKDNKIYLLDMNDTTGSGDKTFTLTWPAGSGLATATFLYADSLAFDLDNKNIIFDSASTVTLQDSSTYESWNIGKINIETGTVTALITSPSQNIAIGNPSPAKTKSNLIVVDKVNTATGTSQTYVMNLDNTNQSGLVVEEAGSPYYGFASFNGDDTNIALQYNHNIVNIPLTYADDGTVSGNSNEMKTICTSAYFPCYLRNDFDNSGGDGDKTSSKINLSSYGLSFSATSVGSSSTKTLTISNTGSDALVISSFSLSNTTDFSHNGQPTTLAAKQSTTITITFKPQDANIQTGSLAIASNDPQAPSISVSLWGLGVSDSDTDSTVDDSTDDDPTPGCFIATAAYGSPMAGEVSLLRQFRDNYLVTNRPGLLFVHTYYRYSPPLAAWIAPHPVVRAAVRVALSPIICSIKYPILATILFSLAIASIGKKYISRRPPLSLNS